MPRHSDADMLFKLAFRNITAKPARAIATVIAIAAAIAMIFAMLSFKPAVYDYIYKTETAFSGDCEVRISTSSSSDRLAAVSGLVGADGTPKLAGIEKVIPTLKLFATVGEDYVQVRGLSYGGTLSSASDICVLRDITLEEGTLDGMRSDDVVISRAAAEHFGIGAGDALTLDLGGRSRTVYVKAIAAAEGYFLADAPYLVLGFSPVLSELIMPSVELCNEIYIKAEAGCDIDALIAEIKGIEAYSAMLIGRMGDSASVGEQATSLTAPIVLAGAAVMALGVCVIVLLFLMSEKEKLSLISRLSMVGADRKWIIKVFAVEGLLLAAAGAVLGAGLAVGVFAGILRLTLASGVGISISAWRLLLAEGIGFVVAVASSFLPVFKAFGGSIRSNMLAMDRRSVALNVLAAVMLAATVVLLALLLTLDAPDATSKAALGIALLGTSLITLAAGLPVVLRGAGKLMSKCASPALKAASYRLVRDKRPARSVAVLGVGMAVSMMLFMAWSLTTSIFSSYTRDFADMAIVTNISSSVDIAEFEQTEGVKAAVKLVWQDGRLGSESFDRSVRVLGSREVLSLTDFAFVTDEDVVRARLAGDEDFIFVDVAFCRLYGVREGDLLTLTLDGKERDIKVGGVLSHRLFNGAYVIASDGVMRRLYGLEPDTVLVTASGDIGETVGALGEKFSAKNYYIIEALEAFRWDMQTVQSVFDLIGTLAFTVAAFILAVCVANTLVGRAGEDKSRRALLSAGMSKDMLFASELAEHGALALICYAAAFIFALPMTVGLIAALNLFGLSFEFMFEAWTVATAGAVMGLMYFVVPIVFGFRRGYTLKK